MNRSKPKRNIVFKSKEVKENIIAIEEKKTQYRINVNPGKWMTNLTDWLVEIWPNTTYSDICSSYKDKMTEIPKKDEIKEEAGKASYRNQLHEMQVRRSAEFTENFKYYSAGALTGSFYIYNELKTSIDKTNYISGIPIYPKSVLKGLIWLEISWVLLILSLGISLLANIHGINIAKKRICESYITLKDWQGIDNSVSGLNSSNFLVLTLGIVAFTIFFILNL